MNPPRIGPRTAPLPPPVIERSPPPGARDVPRAPAARPATPHPEAPSARRPTRETAADTRTRHANDLGASRFQHDLSRAGQQNSLGDSPDVQAGHRVAREIQHLRVFSPNDTPASREAALQQRTQMDTDRGVHERGPDNVRCGASAITAGMVLQGPDAMDAGIDRLDQRLTRLESRAAAGGDDPRAAAAREDLRHARAALDDLRGGPDVAPEDRRRARNFTHGDLSNLEDAIYRTSRAEDALEGRGGGAGMNVPTIRDYRDIMWGEGQRPQVGGRDVDIAVHRNAPGGFGAPEGHVVLVEDRPGQPGATPIIYDPWPNELGRPTVSPDTPIRPSVAPQVGPGLRRGYDIDDGERNPPSRHQNLIPADAIF